MRAVIKNRDLIKPGTIRQKCLLAQGVDTRDPVATLKSNLRYCVVQHARDNTTQVAIRPSPFSSPFPETLSTFPFTLFCFFFLSPFDNIDALHGTEYSRNDHQHRDINTKVPRWTPSGVPTSRRHKSDGDGNRWEKRADPVRPTIMLFSPYRLR